jgi:hypothetical protein
MKNQIILALLGVLLFTGCKKELPLEKSNITNQMVPKSAARLGNNYENDYDYLIRSTSYGLLKLGLQNSFVTYVNNRCADQFDGDDDILIKDLSSLVYAQYGMNLYNKLDSSLIQYGDDSLESYLVDAINGMNYYNTKIYAQIYIPYLSDNINKTNPVICLNYEDTATSSLQGIYLSGGTLHTVTVDDNYAQTHLVWVVSVNETVDSSGVTDVGDNYKTNTFSKVGEVDAYNITDKKEDWYSGKADLKKISMVTLGNGTSERLANCAGAISGYGDYAIAKVSNSDLGSWRNINLSNPILRTLNGAGFADNLHLWGASDVVGILFYEYDVREKYSRSAQIFSGCGYSTVYYKSKETPYGIVYPLKSNFPTTTGAYDYYKFIDASTTDLTGGSFEVRAKQY